MKALSKAALIGVAIAFYSTAASAQLTNQGMLDQVVTEFATRATSWQTVVMNAAMFLFWTLGTISLVFTFGFMALRKADIGEFFAEFIRFILFFGFFLWLLRYGPTFANSIIQSLARIGEQASGVASVTPSGIVDIGFMILKQAFSNSSIWSPVDSFIGVALSLGILILLAVVAINMLLLLVSGWLLMYAGIFFLGFGGSRWTSDMAINYYKTVLGVAVQIMTMVLLVGIGNDLLSSFYARMNTGTLNFEELANAATSSSGSAAAESAPARLLPPKLGTSSAAWSAWLLARIAAAIFPPVVLAMRSAAASRMLAALAFATSPMPFAKFAAVAARRLPAPWPAWPVWPPASPLSLAFELEPLPELPAGPACCATLLWPLLPELLELPEL
jgi:type IV secretion system protein TrbL